jgi:hypothetical protein
MSTRINKQIPLTDGGDECVIESIVRESEQDARLPDSGITDQQQLEQVIIRLLGHDYGLVMS